MSDKAPADKVVVKEVPFPDSSNLERRDYDYVDSFQVVLPIANDHLSFMQLLQVLVQVTPGWVVWMMKLRDGVVKPFGLKTNEGSYNPADILANVDLKPHTKIGLFHVYDVSDKEIIIGEDDRHLNFSCSLIKVAEGGGTSLMLTTVVDIHNRLGKLYFGCIKPFHRLLVPLLLRYMAREITRRHRSGQI